jgi:hypothetical protein
MWPQQNWPTTWAPWKQALVTSLFLADYMIKHGDVCSLPLCHCLGHWHSNHSQDQIWPA